MTSDATPLVSVIVPTYNRPEYLRLALASAVRQSYGNLEIIVQDNASEVDPADVVASFGDPRIKYFRNASNIGTTASVATAFGKAKGKYIAILGDDDLWQTEFIATLVGALEADSELVIAFCDHDIIDAAGKRDDAATEQTTRLFRRHLLHEGVHRPFDGIALVSRSICVVSAAVMRRDAIDWRSLPAEMLYGGDLYLAYLAARTGMGCYYTPRRLAQYRYHAGSLGSGLKQTERRIANARDSLFYWDVLVRDGALRRNRRYFEMKRGSNALVIVASLFRRGERREALRQLRQFWSDGLIHPRIFLDHLLYAVRLHRTTS